MRFHRQGMNRCAALVVGTEIGGAVAAHSVALYGRLVARRYWSNTAGLQKTQHIAQDMQRERDTTRSAAGGTRHGPRTMRPVGTGPPAQAWPGLHADALRPCAGTAATHGVPRSWRWRERHFGLDPECALQPCQSIRRHEQTKAREEARIG